MAVNKVGNISTFEDNNYIIANCSFLWTISEFSSHATSKILDSPSFYAGVNNLAEWNIRAYPNGDDKESEGYMSLYLRLVSSYKPVVFAKFKFSILNAKKVEVNKCESIKRKFLIDSSNWGWNKFQLKEDLLNKSNSLLTNDDKLTIACDIMIYGNIKDETSKLQITDHLQQILSTPKFSDVTLVIGKNKFQAHKEILAARSPVFFAMFNHEMMENKENQIIIIDMKPKVLQTMLHFIYTDKVPNLNYMAEDLLAAADKYQLERLKLICEEVLYLNLTIENAAKILELADLHNSGQFKIQVLKFICMHASDVAKTEEFKSMSKELLVECFTANAVENQSLSN